MSTATRPDKSTMMRAFLDRDPSYEGLFVVAVRTTGIFCRPTCPARRPRAEHVEFFPDPAAARAAGYRPCLRCRPEERAGTVPEWLAPFLAEVEGDPGRRWTDADLRARSLDPARVRRWFLAHRGATFHGWQRARRLGAALERIGNGADLTEAAYDAGFESPSGFRDAFARLFGDPPGRARARTRVVVTRILTPLGPMVAGSAGDGICLLEFTDRRMLETQITRLRRGLGAAFAPGESPALDALRGELEEYFAGTRAAFGVPPVLHGTPFQESVWRALLEIPYGETLSYEGLARRIGRPSAVRAVGRANGDNRLAVMVPCHRVVGADGKLRGYGGGLWRKEALLALERRAGGG